MAPVLDPTTILQHPDRGGFEHIAITPLGSCGVPPLAGRRQPHAQNVAQIVDVVREIIVDG